jgi:adenosylhomocysteine nucleosidase
MRILVTFALENEFAPWRAMRRFRAGNSGSEVPVAEVGGAEVEVVLTGVGPKQARLRASQVLRGHCDSISLCISSGFAGALKNGQRIGDVLAARAVLSDADLEGRRLESSGALVSFAGECGASIVERFYSAQRVIGTGEEKRYLGAIADAVETESFEILREAAACGVPAAAIRAISDLADEDLPIDMNGILNEDGRVSVPRVLGQVTLHPESVPGLVKLGQQSKRAAESLARFLDRYVTTVAERARTLEVEAVRP